MSRVLVYGFNTSSINFIRVKFKPAVFFSLFIILKLFIEFSFVPAFRETRTHQQHVD